MCTFQGIFIDYRVAAVCHFYVTLCRLGCVCLMKQWMDEMRARVAGTPTSRHWRDELRARVAGTPPPTPAPPRSFGQRWRDMKQWMDEMRARMASTPTSTPPPTPALPRSFGQRWKDMKHKPHWMLAAGLQDVAACFSDFWGQIIEGCHEPHQPYIPFVSDHCCQQTDLDCPCLRGPCMPLGATYTQYKCTEFNPTADEMCCMMVIAIPFLVGLSFMSIWYLAFIPAYFLAFPAIWVATCAVFGAGGIVLCVIVVVTVVTAGPLFVLYHAGKAVLFVLCHAGKAVLFVLSLVKGCLDACCESWCYMTLVCKKGVDGCVKGVDECVNVRVMPVIDAPPEQIMV